jgi:aminopeptidase
MQLEDSVMTDVRLENLAKILVQYSTKVTRGDWVWVRGDVHSLPLVNEVVRYVLRAGANVNITLGSDDLTEINLLESSEEQLKWVSPIEKTLIEQVDVMIAIWGAINTRNLSNIDPDRQRTRQQARRGLTQTYMQRAAEGKLRWTLTNFPCPAFAQDADMSLREYEDFVYSATYADQADPIKRWQDIYENQQRLVDWLKGKKDVVVRGPNADLKLSIEGRTFINCYGDKNMPDGEIFTGPVEDSVNGWIKFTYPAIEGGREVEGVELEFKDGKVVAARAQKNEDFLLSMLDSDAGARYLGEFAIGTNYGIQRFTKSILYDEKIGGSIHMAVGAGYPESGSRNESSIHWDFICDMRDNSEILVDGELFYKNGEFKV